jgi:biopolymer transport protein ExbD
MNLRGYRMRDEPEINFIPLIDVLLVILIFLMVSTTYQRIRELQIMLPEANAATPEVKPVEVNVGVDAQCNYVLNKQVFRFSTVEDFAEMLLEAAQDGKDPVVIINADAGASHQSVIRVMEAARLADMPRITFATRIPGS